MGSVKGSTLVGTWLLLISFLFSGAAQGQTLKLDPTRIFEGMLPTPRPQAVPVQSGPEVVYQGFMYVEPNQMRFEVLMDVASAQKVVELEVTDSLDEAQRAALKSALEAKAAGWCLARATQTLPSRFAGVLFMAAEPGVEPGTTEDAKKEAVVGLSWSFPIPAGATGIDLQWKGYFEDQKELPIQIFYGAETESVIATPEIPVLEWRPDEKLRAAPPLLAVPSLDLPPPSRLPLASIVCFVGGFVIFLGCKIRGHRLPGGGMAFFSAWLVGAVLTWPFLVIKIPGSLDKALPTEPRQAERIVSPLLRNIYRSYDYWADSEKEVLAILPRSLTKDALKPVHQAVMTDLLYNEEVTSPRLRLSELNLTVDQVRKNPSDRGFIADCLCQAKVEGFYWGEPVTKELQHKVEVHVSAREGEWKIAKIEKTP